MHKNDGIRKKAGKQRNSAFFTGLRSFFLNSRTDFDTMN